MKLSAKIIAGFGFVLMLLVILVLINQRFNRYVKTDTRLLDKSQEVLRLSSDLQDHLAVMDNGLHKYLFLNDTSFLQDYYLAASQFDDLFKNKSTLVAEDSAQSRRYAELDKMVNEWKFAYAVPLILAKKDSKISHHKAAEFNILYRDLVLKKKGKAKMAAIRSVFDDFENAEGIKQDSYRQELNLSLYRSDTISVILAIFIFFIGLGITIFTTYNISHRMNSMVGLAEMISEGHFTQLIKDRGHDEMSRLANSLNRMTDALRKSFTRLEKANEDLTLANHDLERFAYLASHDLKEPVRMVSMYTQLLATRFSDSMDEDAKQYVQFAVEGSKRIISMLNDLLEYVNISHSTLDCHYFDTKEEVEEVLKDLRDEIKDAGAVIDVGDLPEIFADRRYIRQLFFNLVQNSLRFKKPAEVLKIKISGNRDEDGWYFSVEDNGSGISSEYADRIFIIFQKLQNRSESSGNGVGLTLAKKIVEMHGGRIWFESDGHSGSTFRFYIPEPKKEEYTSLGIDELSDLTK